MADSYALPDSLLAGERIIKQAIVAVAPKFDEIISVDFTYQEGGYWHSVDITWKDWLKIMQTGEFEDRKLAAICPCEQKITLEDGSEQKIRLIYDFVLLNTNRNPWRLS